MATHYILILNSGAYDQAFQQKMELYAPRLWEHLDRIPALPPTCHKEILTYLLDLACQSQHIRNIELGRTALWNLPQEWLLDTIEEAATFLLDTHEKWEYRRLIEVYWHMNTPLTRRLVDIGLNSPNCEIRETAQECEDKLQKHGLYSASGAPPFDYWEQP